MSNIVGSSPAIGEVRRQVALAARKPVDVLIRGDTGSGKEVVARAIHLSSGRAEGRFVPVNCSAIPETLLETQLFGHERGAFTGALVRHAGYFEQASGGTTLLDEIGDLPLTAQAKLLRVLQDVDGQNYIGAVFPSMPNGATLYKWDDSSQQYITCTFIGGAWNPANITLGPGEGAIIQPGSVVAHSYVGQVAQGYGVNSIPNLLSIRSSIVPQAGRVTTDLGLPVISGDIVYRMVNGVNVTYTYNSGVWSPSEPSVAVGESFWNKKNVGFWWHRNFLVWPGWPP